MIHDPAPVARSTLPPGEEGIDVTVETMSKLAMGSLGARHLDVQRTAYSIRQGLPEKDQEAEVRAVHAWVQTHVTYVRDPVGQEKLTAPLYLLKQSDAERVGDCDDHSTLEAALLGALGIPTRFVVVGFTRPGVFSHVYLQALVRGQWIPLDPIVKDQPSGWEAPNPVARKVYPVNSADGFPQGAVMTTVATLGAVAALLILVSTLMGDER